MARGSDNVVIYYRNHNASDTTRESVLNDLVARSVDRLGFSAPEGMEFSAWNTAQDASGISYAVGDTVALSQNSGAELYAVWVVPVIPYIVTSEELTDVADAIRTKGGTSAALVWPSGYVDAIGAIESGGGGGPYVVGNNITSVRGITISPVIASANDTITVKWASSKYLIQPGEGLGIKAVNGTTLTVLQAIGMIAANATFTFSMPSQDVVLDFVQTM